MKKLTPNLLQSLIDINTYTRKNFPKEEMLNPNFSSEFKFIRLNLGRAAGHTHSMMHVANEDDLVLMCNSHMVYATKVAYFAGHLEMATWRQFNEDSNQYLGIKRRYVWVDAASALQNISKPVIDRLQQQPSAYDAVILLG